jgi:uncharacterized lipoprotein YddW (UPF0748 family)
MAALAWAALLCCATGCDGPAGDPWPQAALLQRPGVDSRYPPLPREFRGVWVATVDNLDWPSDRSAAPAQQQAEARVLLDQAQALHLNAVILQVRPACDAFYVSKLEPWSEYLTGTSGQAPEPFYDPLAFWITESHRRGLELHAWFNLYRAAMPGHAALGPTHIARQRPDLVRSYGDYLWLDPGEPEVADHSLAVILDVVRRYDIDAVHLDDYFYPYRDYAMGEDFPDDASWQKYRAAAGTLTRGDWRRQNVNQLVARLSAGIKGIRASVKFGISPFGIWRPGYPAPIKGLDAYDELYADSKLWLNQGWVDYLAPQLYWAIAKPAQSYTTLLDWWVSQNSRQVHLWPGSDASRVADGTASAYAPEEIVAQIEARRARPGTPGNIHFSMSDLVANRQGLGNLLRSSVYAGKALVPASPWLDDTSPPPPTVHAQYGTSFELSLRIVDSASSGFLHVVYWQDDDGLHADVAAATETAYVVQGKGDIVAVAVSAISRTGMESPLVHIRPSMPTLTERRPR